MNPNGYSRETQQAQSPQMAGGWNVPGQMQGQAPPGEGQSSTSLFVSAARRLTARENPLASYSSFCFLYSSFFDWCCSTIPPMSCSLREIAFVVFVELWSRLLPISEKKAQAFLKKFGNPHFIAHHNEISEMKRVKNLMNVRDTSFVSRILRGEKFNLHVGLLTRKLLTTRLTLENDTVILDILQKRIQFETPAGNSPDTSTLAVLASQTFRSPVSRDVGGAIVTPSLALLSGLLPPDLGCTTLDTSSKPFIPEADATMIAPQLAALYRTPIALRLNSTAQQSATPPPSVPPVGSGPGSGGSTVSNGSCPTPPQSTVVQADMPALNWRLDLEAHRRYKTYLRRAEVSRQTLPEILECRVAHQKIRGLSTAGLETAGVIHSAVVNPVGGAQVALCDNNCFWIFDAAESQWSQAASLYEDAIVTPWAQEFVDGASRTKERDDVLDELVVLNRDKEVDYTHGSVVMHRPFGEPPDGAPQVPMAARKKPANTGIRCLTGHSMLPISFKFVPPFLTGQSMCLGLSGGCDEKMILWDVKEAEKLYTYRCGSAVNAVDVDPFGYLFASAHHDRAACLWAMDRPNPLRVFPRHYSTVEAVAFHPNSILLATGSSDESRLRIWDPRVPDIVGAITGVPQPRIISFSPNGRLICVGGFSSCIHVWDIVAAKLFGVLDLSKTSRGKNHRNNYPVSVSFSNNSKLLAACSNNGVVSLWDPNQSAPSATPNVPVVMTEVTAAPPPPNDPTNLCLEIECQNSKAFAVQFTETNVLIVPSITTSDG